MPEWLKRYGTLDGLPIVYNDAQAWLYAGGKWTATDTWQAQHELRMLTTDEFAAKFPDLPALPSEAFTAAH